MLRRLLAQIPADSPAVDWIAVALALVGGVALALGVLTPEQLPGALEACLALLTAAGVRGASLAVRRVQPAEAAAKAIADAVESARAGRAVSDEIMALAAALIVAGRKPSSPAQVAIVPRRDPPEGSDR